MLSCHDLAYRFAIDAQRRAPDAVARLGGVEDLAGEICLALCHAALCHDPTRGKFTTLAWLQASHTVSQALERATRCPTVSLDFAEEVPASGAAGWLDQDESLLVADAVAGLAPREARIVQGRVEGMTLQALADELRLTKERIRQIEAKALGRLRKLLARFATK